MVRVRAYLGTSQYSRAHEAEAAAAETGKPRRPFGSSGLVPLCYLTEGITDCAPEPTP